jgi:hypothetical protein
MSTTTAKIKRALTKARNDAASRVGENEQLIADSVRIDGPGYARHDDDSLMDFHYLCTVMMAGCSGWSMPV